MPKLTFTLEEVLAIQSGEMSEELAGRVNEAKNLDKFKALRTAAEDVLNKNAAEFIDGQLKPLSIPAGVKSIDLVYTLNTESMSFAVRSGGVKVDFAGEGAVSEDVTTLVTKAQEAKANKNNGPLAFITKSLGESRLAHVIALRDFDVTKTALDALYTNTEAQALCEGLGELPPGDKCVVKIQYSTMIPDPDKAGVHFAGWIVNATVSKTAKVSGGGNGNGGKPRFRVTAPEGHSNWTAYAASGVDSQAKEILDALIAKWGDTWNKHQSITNALKAAGNEAYLTAYAARETEFNANGE